MDSLLPAFMQRLERLEQLWAALEDRVSVLEEESCDNRNRLEDLEEWQEKVDDELDEY